MNFLSNLRGLWNCQQTQAYLHLRRVLRTAQMRRHVLTRLRHWAEIPQQCHGAVFRRLTVRWSHAQAVMA
jgi:hypothetical protein